MNPEVTDLQKQRDELRARLLANTEIRDQIAFRAYEIYENRRGENGSALEDWLRAENEIVSSLVEQELQLLSVSAQQQDLEGNPGQSARPRVKREKALQLGSASNSKTTKRKASTRSAAPAASKAVKKEKKTSRTVRKPSDASVRAKEGNELGSQPVPHD